MAILKFDGLFTDSEIQLTTPAPTSTTTIASIGSAAIKATKASVVDTMQERLVETCISVAVCIFFYLLKILCKWILDRLKSCEDRKKSGALPPTTTHQQQLIEM
jgi:hypothetical protein